MLLDETNNKLLSGVSMDGISWVHTSGFLSVYDIIFENYSKSNVDAIVKLKRSVDASGVLLQE